MTRPTVPEAMTGTPAREGSRVDTSTIGVAMCTCNGAAYLREQLDSIASQSRRPDHVVVFDDASTDGTWALLESWQSEMHNNGTGIRITLHRNEPRLGIVRNFEAATRALDTDLVFLCDQDDIWLPDKVATIEAAFHADPRRTLVFTDAELIDATGARLGATLFDRLRFSAGEAQRVAGDDAFLLLSRRSVVTGATAAFRRLALQDAYPFPLQWLHDEWLAIMTAAGAGRLHCLRTPTILYRQHGRNAVGVQRQNLFTQTRLVWWRLNAPRGRAFAENFRLRCTALVTRLVALDRDPRWIAVAERMRAFADFRQALPASPPLRVLSVVGHVGQYRQFTEGFEDFARDMANR